MGSVNKNILLKQIPGQLIVLQVSVDVDWLLHTPPWASTTVLFLVFVSSPVPQVLLQLPLLQTPH